MTIRPATPNDLDTIIELIHGLADYEHEPNAVRLDRETLCQHLFGARPYAEVLLSEEEGGQTTGFALFFHNFSTWEGQPGIWLEDLFVRPEFRDRGYGKALLRAVARLAVQRGCARFEWSVLDWNEPSIGFYRAMGAIAMDEWTTFRLSGAALRELAAHETD